MHFILYADKSSSWGERWSENLDGDRLLGRFRSVLSQLGGVTDVDNPHTEVDPIYRRNREAGEGCVFLCFALPHRVPLGLECPIVPVFAWGHSKIPDGSAKGRGNGDDWRLPLTSCGRAIVFSDYAARTIRAAMGDEFPVIAIAPPVHARPLPEARGSSFEICVSGIVVDSVHAGYSPDYLISSLRPEKEPNLNFIRQSLQYGAQKLADWRTAKARNANLVQAVYPEICLQLQGVVYTTIFDPANESTNWFDLVSAFSWTLRDETDATLALNLPIDSYASHRDAFVHAISRLAPFKCRIVLIWGALNDEMYARLIQATSYYVNTSQYVGHCLPLMEFMACEKPALAPSHTAMADYIDNDAAFVLKSSRQLAGWPESPWTKTQRQKNRQEQNGLGWESYRFDWESIRHAYQESYRVAKAEPERYIAMGAMSSDRIKRISSPEAIAAKFRSFLTQPACSHLEISSVLELAR